MNYSTNWIYGKKYLKAKGLTANIEKTKIMICIKILHSLKDSGKHPWGVCCKGVGSNSIFCDGYKSWIHKKCSGFKGTLKADPNYRCKRCMGLCRPVDGRPEKHVTLEDTACCSRVVSLSWWWDLSWRWLLPSYNCENQSRMGEVSWTASSSYVHQIIW